MVLGRMWMERARWPFQPTRQRSLAVR